MSRLPGRGGGFTLIEVLVSVFLLSVLSAFAYGTLNYVGRSREITHAAFERTRALQLAMHALVTDFEQLEPRPVREPIGDASQPALLADSRSSNIVTLTRGGWPNPVGLQRGTLQRVSYRLDNGTLIRQYTTVLDTTLATKAVERELLKDVVALKIRYMDASHVWQDQWPAAATSIETSPLQALVRRYEPPLRARPLAVEITLEQRDSGTVVRLVEVPG